MSANTTGRAKHLDGIQTFLLNRKSVTLIRFKREIQLYVIGMKRATRSCNNGQLSGREAEYNKKTTRNQNKNPVIAWRR